MRVLKVGGNELDDPGFIEFLAQSVFRIRNESGEPVIVVHGGGQAIAGMQAKLGLEAVKVDGLRVTDAQSLAVAEMVLSGHSNKILVKALLAAGLDAVGISGVDGGLLRCHKKQHPTVDLGYVGEIVYVRAELLQQLAGLGLTMVISPISLGDDNLSYNVNADEAAWAVAEATKAVQLDFISNVPGVLQDGQVIPLLTPEKTEQLIQNGTIMGGMIPKVRSALLAIDQGVARARIVDLVGLAGSGGTSFIPDPNQGGQIPT